MEARPYKDNGVLIDFEDRTPTEVSEEIYEAPTDPEIQAIPEQRTETPPAIQEAKLMKTYVKRVRALIERLEFEPKREALRILREEDDISDLTQEELEEDLRKIITERKLVPLIEVTTRKGKTILGYYLGSELQYERFQIQPYNKLLPSKIRFGEIASLKNYGFGRKLL